MTRSLSVGPKCSVPRVPESLVRRPRLERLLANEERHQVTLLSAMPGTGKTTLVTSWLATTPVGPVGWLTLDPRDDEPGRLADLVVAALARAGATDGFDPPDDVGDDLHDALFEHLVRVGRPTVLVLDDVHEVTSKSALRTLEHLVRQAPRVLDLVLAARADPPVRWGGLEVEGRLRQVRNADLRFDAGEAAELLRRHGVHLGREDTQTLCDRTEGWAAGLRLAACALQSDAEPRKFVLSASATQVAVSDYLLTEVLDREDDMARQFLLRTSVVDRLTPDLARTLSGDPRSGDRLRALERRGMFLVELDDDGSYRYHALFAALLRARLRLREPALVTELHRRAARWHLARGLAFEAEHHARIAGDWELAGRLARERWLEAVLTGAAVERSGMTDAPAAATERVADLALVAAADACRRGDRHEADSLRDVVDRSVGDDDAGPGADAATVTARLVLDLEHGRAFGPDARSERAVERLLDGAAAAAAGLPAGARRLATLREAEFALAAGALPSARAALAALAAEPGADHLRREAAALSGLADALTGQLACAEASAASVLGELDHSGAAAANVAHLALAYCGAQRGDLRGMSDALAAIDASVVMPHAARAPAEVARAAARHRSGRPPTLDDSTFELPLAADVLVALGVPEAVDARGHRLPVRAPGMRPVAACRKQLAGEPAGPEAGALDAWLDHAAAQDDVSEGPPPHPRTRVEATLLSAVIAGDLGHDDVADRRLDDALVLLEHWGIRAPFDHYADRLAGRLRRCAATPGPHAALVIDLLDRLGGPGDALLVEALTDRELEVLRRLPTLMSNAEIAAGMHVSVNTVKSHLKAVYRKLGVDGRRQAVLRGRQQELL